MASNYKAPGKIVTLAAPYNRTTGQGALVGSLFGVALVTVLSTVEAEFATDGVWTLAKTSAQAWTVGQKVYWDDSNKRCDTDSTVGQLIGVATAVAANPSSTGDVRLNGVAPATSEGAQAAIADIVDNGGGATADGTIGAVTAPTALTDSTGGAASATLAAITTFTPSVAWNGSSVYPSAADATAIAAAITSEKNSIASLAARQAEDRTAVIALTDAIKELSAKYNTLLAELRIAGIISA